MYYDDPHTLVHYGTKRHSGRYPWGSGDEPYQSGAGLSGRISELRKDGLSDTDIARTLGMTTTELRARRSIEKNQKRAADVSRVIYLKDKGYSNAAIGREMGINESSVRSLLNTSSAARTAQTDATVDVLRAAVGPENYIDVGKGTNLTLGVSETRLKTALQALEDDGYSIHYIKVEQATIPGQFTTVKVLAPPNTPWKDVANNTDRIGLVNTKFEDQFSTSVLGMNPVKYISSDRVEIAYKSDKDGVIELRPNTKDLNLGDSRYAQVRIGVDKDKFLKGMAIYADDLPDGIDIRYHTNKNSSVAKEEVFKKTKKNPDGSVDEDNPFGATIKPGGQSGFLNIVYEEGDWADWDKSLASQMLSKQPVSLAKQQLDLGYAIKKAEYDEIMSLTNPTVKKHLLESYSDDLDAAASHLKAAALPRQASHVILPLTKIKENEVYAPNYKNGEQVALVRYPHGGTFEIPELVVNNNNKQARSIFKNAADAIGINPKVAERLSGADFDGDTVIVIPNNNRSVKSTPALKGLQNFDPKTAYPGYEGMPKMKSATTQNEMGKITNLITDMSIQKASPAEITRAVKHSMVVIDAEKHGLNYKQSALDNNIAQLKEKYQGGARSGSSTLISKANANIRVDERKMYAPIDPKTGKRVYSPTNNTYINAKGETVARTQKSTNMREASDAYSLSSGTTIENVYADYANSLKSLANMARKNSVNTADIVYSPSAKKTYGKEAASVRDKLETALKNAPLERQAQLLANQIVVAKKADNPGMDKERETKVKNQAITEARARVGAGKQHIQLTDGEWQAIQSGAVSKTTLETILKNSDQDYLKQLAMPRTQSGMTGAQETRAKAYLSSGYTQAEVASLLGVSVSTLAKAVA